MKKVISTFIILLFIFSCCSDSDHQQNSEHDTPDQYWNTDDNCDDAFYGTCCVVNGSMYVKPNSLYTYIYNGNKKTSEIQWEVVSGSITLIKGQGTHRAVFLIGKDFTTGAVQASNNKGLKCGNRLNITKLEK
ncbi:hypothetical protein [Flavobacterium quisquiliarum]|jgi:uncharacterized protein involved in tellurium resistance|uniref:Lipoprotein n=1 Tax=Flavobacterium quisquiliarum TaxID=1834436 RepID=A0ABV8W4U2_9FLAO|nr:hypothetical protein [Flavobacterium quisquiliarum]MBW1657201.1 hypothetical protein [Flavobacterium quisquiliarum]NWL00486.1 hypothetical protein [Flavobacterium collinsii]